MVYHTTIVGIPFTRTPGLQVIQDVDDAEDHTMVWLWFIATDTRHFQISVVSELIFVFKRVLEACSAH